MVATERFEPSRDTVLGDGAGAPESCVGEVGRSFRGSGNGSNAETPGPARAGQIPGRQGLAPSQCFAQGANPPTGRRDGAAAADEQIAQSHLRKIRLALAPPKPNELLSA